MFKVLVVYIQTHVTHLLIWCKHRVEVNFTKMEQYFFFHGNMGIPSRVKIAFFFQVYVEIQEQYHSLT